MRVVSQEALRVIQSRVSITKLIEPAPNASELLEAFKAAARAPDHGKLQPWRFMVIEGEGLELLSRTFLAALANSWLIGIWVVVFFAILQQLEGILLAPLIMGKTTGLSPLVVLIALLIGAKIAGLIGFLLAIPLAIIVQEIFEEGVRRKTQV